MKSSPVSSPEKSFEDLEELVYDGLQMHRQNGKNFVDPAVDAVYQACLTLESNRNLEALNSLQEKLSVCEQRQKGYFPYPEIKLGIERLRGCLQTPTHGETPETARKNKP